MRWVAFRLNFTDALLDVVFTKGGLSRLVGFENCLDRFSFGLGGRFVSHLSGSYFAVVGLPLYETEQLLNEFLRG